MPLCRLIPGPLNLFQGESVSAQFLKDALGWGFVLWLIGYALGIMLFTLVPAGLIGWIITPIGTAIALWIAFRKVNGDTLGYYALVALIWVMIALLGDYLFIVKAFKPADGYYKLDVYIYYALTLAIPLLAGWRRTCGRPPGGRRPSTGSRVHSASPSREAARPGRSSRAAVEAIADDKQLVEPLEGSRLQT
jgi:hypothetical protein